MRIEFYLNSERIQREVAPGLNLLDLLRKEPGEKYIREGCRKGHCGVCTVILDDLPAASCLVPVFNLSGVRVETISGFMQTPGFEDLEKGFLKAGFSPCKYCTPTKVLMAETILRENDAVPDEAYILGHTNDSWCNCSSRAGYVRGVQSAALIRQKRRSGDAHRP